MPRCVEEVEDVERGVFSESPGEGDGEFEFDVVDADGIDVAVGARLGVAPFEWDEASAM